MQIKAVLLGMANRVDGKALLVILDWGKLSNPGQVFQFVDFSPSKEFNFPEHIFKNLPVETWTVQS